MLCYCLPRQRNVSSPSTVFLIKSKDRLESSLKSGEGAIDDSSVSEHSSDCEEGEDEESNNFRLMPLKRKKAISFLIHCFCWPVLDRSKSNEMKKRTEIPPQENEMRPLQSKIARE